MSAPVRFLIVAVAGWTAVRAATLGTLPGFTVSYAKQAEAGDLPGGGRFRERVEAGAAVTLRGTLPGRTRRAGLRGRRGQAATLAAAML